MSLTSNTAPSNKKPPRDADGLSPQEREWCKFRAMGYTQADAYRMAFKPAESVKNATIRRRACDVASRAHVKSTLFELLRAAKLSDLDSIGRAHSDTIEMIDESRSQNNLTAAASFQRQRQQALGMLTERVVHSIELTSDEEIVRTLANGDPEKERLLWEMLGAPSSFAPRKVSQIEHSPVIMENDTTKDE